MVMTCFTFMYNLWLSTFVQSMISIISALMATGTDGVWGLIWGQDVLSGYCMESVDPDADCDSEILSSCCAPYGSDSNSINSLKIV